MDESKGSQELRKLIKDELLRRNRSATPQAINALACSIEHSSPELVGDSDSLLVGLFMCSSHTIDLLRDAGGNIDELLYMAAGTATDYTSPIEEDQINPIKSLFSSAGNFGELIGREEFNNRSIEAADLLQEAISTKRGWRGRREPDSGFKSSAANGAKLRVTEEIRAAVDETIYNFCAQIWEKPIHTLQTRFENLTKGEISKLRKVGDVDSGDLSHLVRGINHVISRKELPTNDPEFVSFAIYASRIGTIGSDQFINSGGNYRHLEMSLAMSQRYAPERDEPILGLLEQDGKILVQHYSYRGTNSLDSGATANTLSVSSPIILPLVPASVLAEFEYLINNCSISEHSIQKFLECHPEILRSLGYTECRPQVVLSEPGKKDLKPDFILQRPGNNGFDILDLKLPSANIACSTPYTRISHEITKAVAQLRAYGNYFKSEANKDNFIKTHGIEYFEPKLIVAIGRQSQYSTNEIRSEIEQQASGIQLLTYDQMLDYAKARSFAYGTKA